MPTQILEERRPDPVFNPSRDRPPEAYRNIAFSVVEFDPTIGEEIFLSHSTGQGQEHGPGIRRPGDRSPSMRRFWDLDNPFSETTDPDEQRLGTWFTDEDSFRDEERDLREVETELGSASPSGDEEKRKRSERKSQVLQATVDMGRTGGIHTEGFRANHLDPDGRPLYEIIGQQGCGDLSMNFWYVALISSWQTSLRPKLIWLYEEPLTDREYDCLVKWKNPCSITLEQGVRFAPEANEGGRVRIGSNWVHDRIEFAVSGKPIVRDGSPVDFRSIVHQFADVRHLLQLPNINPAGPLYSSEPAPANQGQRYYYGREWRDAVWLGEKQLLEDWNLQRAAIAGPVVLDRLYGGMGVSIEQVQGAMGQARYRSPSDRRKLEMGEWQFVPWNNNLIEVYLRRSAYPWGMIGVNKDKEKPRFYFAACNGHQGRTGFGLDEALERFFEAVQNRNDELWSVLLFDEGNDVFQKAWLDGSLQTTVPLRRRQVRATFIVARKTGAATTQS